MKTPSLLLCMVLLLAWPAIAGTPGDTARLPVTGNFALDVFGMRDLTPAPRVMQERFTGSVPASHKSPWLAAGLSLALPGAGEFYTENYWKSAGFFVIEAAMWGLAYYWDHRGDRQTDSFQNFADAHWSVYRYVDLAIKNFKPKDPSGNYYTTNEFWSGAPNLNAPWVGINWDLVHQMESAIGGYYSHNLAPHGDQQYYEMIGKYEQFNMGWDDANPGLGSDYFTQKANLTPRNVFYAGERAKANTYYGHATTFVTVAIVNHILSAVDGALSASWYNKAHASVGFRTVPDAGGYTRIPVFQLSYDL